MVGVPTRPDLEQQRAARAWCLYDWANSAFATSVVAAILPAFFAGVAGGSLAPHVATAWWGYASAAAMLLSAVTGAMLGAASDRLGRRKPMLLILVCVGAVATAMMAFIPAGGWRVLLLLYLLGFVPWASANVLYDSMLPAVAPPDRMHRVSARGFAYGYLGGGLLLALNLAWILMPRRFGLPDADAAVRLSFVSVGAWWLLFTIPLLRRVPEPGATADAVPPLRLAASVVRQIADTLATARRRPELFRFLIAFWLYSDGIGTIVRMATIYGSEIGIGRNDLIGTLLLVQILAAPASLVFGRLAQRIGARTAVVVGLMGYVGITLFGYFVSRPIHFWILGVMVALFQGGTQSLSRSLFVSLAPRRQLGELFGFYSLSEKLAGIIGPLLFGLVAQLGGSSRLAIFALLPLFLGGAWLLLTVDFGRGAERARE
jgi:UMF1 family MFS transporter